MSERPDMLELAMDTLRDVHGFTPDTEISAMSQFAQAAALVAIAERMDKIVALLEAHTGYGPIEE